MDQKYMKEALVLAKKAYDEREIPIGAVVAYDGKIIGKGYNKRQANHNPIDHAEILAIKEAATYLGSWNLQNCSLYVTVEPCPMCAGALIQSQCSKVFYGAKEANSGSLGSVIDLSKLDYNHRLEVKGGLLEEECVTLMKNFFKDLRNEKVKVKRVSEEDFQQYIDVRTKVFVEEQNVPIEIEIDELDQLNLDVVTHIAAYIDNQMVGTSRLIKDGKTLKVGRVAVLKEFRKFGVGKAMMAYAEKQALNNGFDQLKLGAQVSAIPFYEKSGYVVIGEVYLDANIDHKDMIKNLLKQSNETQ